MTRKYQCDKCGDEWEDNIPTAHTVVDSYGLPFLVGDKTTDKLHLCNECSGDLQTWINHDE